MSAGFSSRQGAATPAAAQPAAGGTTGDAARKHARQQEAEAAPVCHGAMDAAEAEAAAEDRLPPPQQGDCIVFVGLARLLLA